MWQGACGVHGMAVCAHEQEHCPCRCHRCLSHWTRPMRMLCHSRRRCCCCRCSHCCCSDQTELPVGWSPFCLCSPLHAGGVAAAGLAAGQQTLLPLLSLSCGGADWTWPKRNTPHLLKQREVGFTRHDFMPCRWTSKEASRRWRLSHEQSC